MSTPACVQEFLEVTRRRQELKQGDKELKSRLAELQPEVTSWLKTVPDYKYQLTNVEDGGYPGKLRLDFGPASTVLNRSNLTEYLFSYFTTVFADKEEHEIKSFAEAAVAHIWQARRRPQELRTPRVTRVFNQKRQRGEF